MKSPYLRFIELAEKMGIEIEDPEYCERDKSYTIQVPAPDGKQWVNGNCIHLVCVWFHYVSGHKNAQVLDLINRMNEGLEELDETVNP